MKKSCTIGAMRKDHDPKKTDREIGPKVQPGKVVIKVDSSDSRELNEILRDLGLPVEAWSSKYGSSGNFESVQVDLGQLRLLALEKPTKA